MSALSLGIPEEGLDHSVHYQEAPIFGAGPSFCLVTHKNPQTISSTWLLLGSAKPPVAAIESLKAKQKGPPIRQPCDAIQTADMPLPEDLHTHCAVGTRDIVGQTFGDAAIDEHGRVVCHHRRHARLRVEDA